MEQEIKQCQNDFIVEPDDFAFYKKMSLPLPRKCFFCRQADRLKRRGPMDIYDRQCAQCAKCGKEIQTSYAPERPEIVYCEQCYNQEVA